MAKESVHAIQTAGTEIIAGRVVDEIVVNVSAGKTRMVMTLDPAAAKRLAHALLSLAE